MTTVMPVTLEPREEPRGAALARAEDWRAAAGAEATVGSAVRGFSSLRRTPTARTQPPGAR